MAQSTHPDQLIQLIDNQWGYKQRESELAATSEGQKAGTSWRNTAELPMPQKWASEPVGRKGAQWDKQTDPKETAKRDMYPLQVKVTKGPKSNTKRIVKGRQKDS